MRDVPSTASFDATVRRAWAALLADLPRAARGRAWPVDSAAGFERILLDHVLDTPWESAISPPSTRNADPFDLVLAIEMGERLLAGTASVSELDRRSLALRAERTGQPRHCCGPCKAGALADDAAADLLHRAIISARFAPRRPG
jgi:hypothetical protein